MGSVADTDSGDPVERHAEAMGGAGGEIDRIAGTGIGDRHGQATPAVDDGDLSATGEPGVGGGDAPVLVDLAAGRAPTVVPAVIDGGGDGPAVPSTVVGMDWRVGQECEGGESSERFHELAAASSRMAISSAVR